MLIDTAEINFDVREIGKFLFLIVIRPDTNIKFAYTQMFSL
jgi:hypothetical protein